MSDKTPDILIAALRQYQHNDCSGFVAGFDYDETVGIVRAIEAQRDELLAALKVAAEFIDNGIEFGFIRMPDQDTPDSAHKTPQIIRDAIAKCEAQS